MDSGWVDDLRFYVLFNSILAISGRLVGDIERPVQWIVLYCIVVLRPR